MTVTPTVQGRCPACSRNTLILGVGGYVTCSHLGCPDPSVASDLLDRQTSGCPDPIECDHEAALGQAEAKLAAARALHTTEFGNEFGVLECSTCREGWPCPTISALDGPEAQS